MCVRIAKRRHHHTAAEVVDTMVFLKVSLALGRAHLAVVNDLFSLGQQEGVFDSSSLRHLGATFHQEAFLLDANQFFNIYQ